jgi:hypothetical protein
MRVATDRITEPLQALIDSRLETIERMLLGRVPRSERQAIVAEVESQIFDMLDGRDPSGWTREDVLAVLARLDPPEAYLPDPDDVGAAPAARAPAGRPERSTGPAPAATGKLGGVIGLVTFGSLLVSPLIVLGSEVFDSVAILVMVAFSAALLVLAGGVVGVILSARARPMGPWSVVGLVTGILSLLGAVGGVFFLLVELS